MGDKIFISYRRDDASADARSIYQHLRSTFGKDKLFIDVDTIEKGRDFRSAVEVNLDRCGVLLAVIGPRWLSVEDASGRPRLGDPNDFVRIEIAKALAKDVAVIPVLVAGAELPRPEDLPEEIRGLVFRQAARVRHETFAEDMDALQREARKVVRPRMVGRMGLAAGVATACATLVYLMPGSVAPPDAPTGPQKPATGTGPALSRPTTATISRIRLRQAVLVRMSEADWQWIEKDPRDNHEAVFKFRQQAISPSELLLHDASRDMYARLNFVDRRAYWRVGQEGDWNWNYDILEAE